MASLKDLRNRIASVKATQKITKAMQMVAAAKLRRAQEAAESARPYAERMGAVLANMATAAAGAEGAPKLIAGTGRDDVHLLIVCTAERGLCGAFKSEAGYQGEKSPPACSLTATPRRRRRSRESSLSQRHAHACGVAVKQSAPGARLLS